MKSINGTYLRFPSIGKTYYSRMINFTDGKKCIAVVTSIHNNLISAKLTNLPSNAKSGYATYTLRLFNAVFDTSSPV